MLRAQALALLVLLAACPQPDAPPTPDATIKIAAMRPDAPPAPPPPPDAAVKAFTVEAAMDMAEAPDGTFTSGGKAPAKAPEFAVFRVLEGPAVPAAKRAADAKERLGKTDLATAVKVGAQRPIKVDGLDGFETGGTGKHEQTDVTLYQVALYHDGGSFTMQARSSTERWAWYKPAYEKMARSFKRRAP